MEGTLVDDDTAKDGKKLEEKAKELSGEELTIESEEKIWSEFQIMGSEVGAVLVRKKGNPGAFRVTGGGAQNKVQNVVTGPNESGDVIVVIKPGQTGMCLGRPTLRRFMRAA
ncbi:hypothetical protein CC86DRAFT_472985 [Ophiobolus disseminans]|uniref:Uncharacterized protein n=1 Tax=Ophiobolus disseminans TaxID=1469910 RepID=A0A6A6ZAW1_9PLEO|nr:hypothetical protein CC86DRAFT_472985 [Ophiobolus disseminans]